MGDAARSLDREAKGLGRRLDPVGQHRDLGHLIEGVVDLHRRQPLGVPREHGLGRDLLGIEAPLPLLEGVAARTCPELRRVHGDLLARRCRLRPDFAMGRPAPGSNKKSPRPLLVAGSASGHRWPRGAQRRRVSRHRVTGSLLSAHSCGRLRASNECKSTACRCQRCDVKTPIPGAVREIATSLTMLPSIWPNGDSARTASLSSGHRLRRGPPPLATGPRRRMADEQFSGSEPPGVCPHGDPAAGDSHLRRYQPPGPDPRRRPRRHVLRLPSADRAGHPLHHHFRRAARRGAGGDQSPRSRSCTRRTWRPGNSRSARSSPSSATMRPACWPATPHRLPRFERGEPAARRANGYFSGCSPSAPPRPCGSGIRASARSSGKANLSSTVRSSRSSWRRSSAWRCSGRD